MTLRCPVCRADNTTGPTCRRCRADLSMLFAVETRRDHHLSNAAVDIRSGCLVDALRELQRAAELHAGPDICRLRACVRLLQGDFTAAVAEYAAGSRP